MKNISAGRIYDLIRRLDSIGPLDQEKAERYTHELWEAVDNVTPAQIFQYRAGEEEHIAAFAEGKVYLSDPVRFNDPTDGLCYVDLDDVIEETMLEEEGGADDQLRKAIRLGNNALELTSKLRRQVRISCFSETIDSDLMWSHYANMQRGFALRYSTKNLRFPDCDVCCNPFCHSQGFPLYPVLYRDRKSDITEYALFRAKCEMQGIDPETELPIPLLPLIQKRRVWSYEREWRIVCQNKDVEYFNMVPDAVFLGPLIEEDTAVRLYEIAKDRGIPIFKMSINLSSPSFELLQDDWSEYSPKEVRRFFEV